MSNFKYPISNGEPMPQISSISQNPLVTFGEEVDHDLRKIKINELKIVFFGSRDFVIPVIEEVKDKFDLMAIVTVPDQPVGRHQQLTPTSVKEHFLDSGIPIFDPEDLNENFVKSIRDLEPDLFVVAAYGKLIPLEVLNIPKFGAINLHPSLLPKYRGPSPLQNTILNGGQETGMSFMLLDQKMDHGPIIYQTRFSISQEDNFETLGNKIFQRAAEEIVYVIEHFTKGSLKPTEQNHSEATFTKLIKKENGYFDIETPPSPEILDRMIRAYYPWPNAWTIWSPSAKASGDKSVKSHESSVKKVIKFLPNQMVQMEGKKPVSLKDFLNGYPDFPIIVLTSAK